MKKEACEGLEKRERAGIHTVLLHFGALLFFYLQIAKVGTPVRVYRGVAEHAVCFSQTSAPPAGAARTQR